MVFSTSWPAPPNYLAPKQPGSIGQYSFMVCPNAVVPVGVSVAASPSGSGELTLASLGVGRNLASLTFSGGVPGRVYTVAAVAYDAEGNAYQTLFFVPIFRALGIDPPPEPPLDDFGSSIIWGSVVTQFTPAIPSGNLTLVAGGSAQLFASSVINGGIIYNPSTATFQGIGGAESIWVDIAGSSAAIGGGNASIEVQAGEMFNLFGITGAITWTAATTGHKINGVVW